MKTFQLGSVCVRGLDYILFPMEMSQHQIELLDVSFGIPIAQSNCYIRSTYVQNFLFRFQTD